ncbi:hypothetical protein [Litoribrevibacter albus]|uniref:Uncharacterized protein n=1 Tax=Litoribrevibacter albus TaxID=1473156 RepID=A0AA37W841_9GAMM|nr:hypothetical protein [Litoribrevibacter albus]GLQ31121.1 hypothetical protein GCM10007876_16000 [Litoribrevibacter albus]
MKLPDFEQFEPFNELRAQMGANELGSFEPFDPHLQLTSLEVERLSALFIDVPFNRLRSLPDDTLAYKNSRVFVFENKSAREEGIGLSIYDYHLAHCKHLKGETKPKFNHSSLVYVSTQFTQALHSMISQRSEVDSFELRPCWECLHTLRLNGFDGEKHRKRIHSEQVWRTFNITDFTQQFAMYPLPEELWG